MEYWRLDYRAFGELHLVGRGVGDARRAFVCNYLPVAVGSKHLPDPAKPN